MHEPEPAEAMHARIGEVLQVAARFLDRRPTETFEAFRRARLKVTLFIEPRINQDQMDLTLPPELVAACARQGLGIFIISNDISAAEAIALETG